MKQITFQLKGEATSRRVWLNGRELHPARSQKIRNHSPDGFAWGYGGSGPAQLALAVLIELIGPTKAQAHYQQFKDEQLAALDMQGSFEATFSIPELWANICRQCGEVYNADEVKRIYGDYSPVLNHNCCTAQCYTKWRLA